MTSKFSHFAAVGLIVAAGFALTLGVDGRQQVSAMSDVVTDAVSSVVAQVSTVSKDVLATAEYLSFANIYSALGLLTGAVESVEVGHPAAASQVLVVTEADTAMSDREQQALIQDSFSDTVKVVPDATKKSGTIIPVFRGVEGEKYLYVAVPVKK